MVTEEYIPSIEIEESESSRILLVVFAGIAHKLPIPLFEFNKSLEEYKINKIFIRDISQSWYLDKITGLTNSIDETANLLRSYIIKWKIVKTVFIGNSAGGFAALLYGILLNVNEVHSFAPQTFLNHWKRFIYRDNRWSSLVSSVNNNIYIEKKYLNLKKLFKHRVYNNTQCNIYFDASHRLDRIHARQLKKFNVKYFSLKSGGHTIIKIIKDTGLLKEIFAKSFSR